MIISAFGHGLILMAMIYALGAISSAHFNPAVTIGLYLAGRCPKAHVAPYLVAECIGATAAAVGFPLAAVIGLGLVISAVATTRGGPP